LIVPSHDKLQIPRLRFNEFRVAWDDNPSSIDVFCSLDPCSLSPVFCPSIIDGGETTTIMSSLEGKTALVTGASQGIGRACAIELAKAGARVAIAARNEAKLAEVAAEIAAAGGTSQAFAIDIASEDSIKAGAKAAIGHFGSIEILVNNAGITKDGLMLRMKRVDWDAVLSTNLTGTFLLTQAVVSSMLKARWGRIINISSVVGETGQAGQANYAASKAGLIGLTKSLAREPSRPMRLLRDISRQQ
jgi:3-oxoacyl-[acyl-carrier protein] reductase